MVINCCRVMLPAGSKVVGVLPVVMRCEAQASTYFAGYSGSLTFGVVSTSVNRHTASEGTSSPNVSTIIFANCCRFTGSSGLNRSPKPLTI
jgi:hypothetical protein